MGNIGALLSPLLAGMMVDVVGWTMTLELVIIPVIFAIIMWFFVSPDKPLLIDKKNYKVCNHCNRERIEYN